MMMIESMDPNGLKRTSDTLEWFNVKTDVKSVKAKLTSRSKILVPTGMFSGVYGEDVPIFLALNLIERFTKCHAENARFRIASTFHL